MRRSASSSPSLPARLLPCLALGLLLGCGDKSDPPVDTDTDTDTDTTVDTDDTGEEPVITVPDPVGDPATIPLAGACPLESRYGGFVVQELSIFSIVDGSVADAVVPITILEERLNDGTCRLMRRNNPFCDPACGSSQTCDFDGTCIPYPTNQDLGVVTVGGLNKPLVLHAIQPGTSYFDTALPHPVYEPGALIELRTGGGAYDPVVLYGVGVEPMQIVDAQWFINEESPLTIRWEPPQGEINRAHVRLRLNIDQHGNTPIQLFCEFEDTGEAVVSQEMIAALIQAGVTGFPNATLTRRTMDSVAVGDGCMDLMVGAPVEPQVRVEGYVPCFSDNDCPDGKTCNLATQICE